MRFCYIGAPDALPGGHTIVCGNIPVTVGGEFEAPVHLVDRLMRHPHFACAAVEPVPCPVIATPEPEVDLEREALYERAEAAGVKIDKRWNSAKITAAIEAKAQEAE